MKKTLLVFAILLSNVSMARVDDSTQSQVLVTIADAKSSPAVALDLGEPGDSVGDQWLFDQPLLDTSRNTIGNNSGFCIRTLVGSSSQCQWTLTLPNGTIQVAGREFDQGNSAISIVGGTGEYQHISGEMISFKNSDGTFTQTLTYSLKNTISLKQTKDAKALVTNVRDTGLYSCAECHGDTGNPPITDKYDKQSPSLAGQNYQYLLSQLEHFKSGSRYTEEMANIMQNYTHEEISQIALYFSQQIQTKTQPFDPSVDTLKHSVAEDVLWVQKGQLLYQQGDKERGIVACKSCHGASGNGGGQYISPRLASQHARYVRMALQDYRAGERTTDKIAGNVMRLSVKNLNDDDIKYLGAYIQSMPIVL